jgi:hypothetical protein
MQVLPGIELSQSHIRKIFSKHIRSSGFFRSQTLETLKISPLVWRPFRRVRWECLSETGQPVNPCYTYLDEQFAGKVTDPVEQLLLWRPKYADLSPVMFGGVSDKNFPPSSNSATLQELISKVLEDWQMAQVTMSSLTPVLRETQSGIDIALSAFLPRTPSRRRRERELVEDRKRSHALMMALSMMLNCPNHYVIQEGILENRIRVGTVFGEYEHLEDHSKRYLVLETAGARTVTETLKNGRALTRLLKLNHNCEIIIQESIQFSS